MKTIGLPIAVGVSISKVANANLQQDVIPQHTLVKVEAPDHGGALVEVKHVDFVARKVPGKVCRPRKREFGILIQPASGDSLKR